MIVNLTSIDILTISNGQDSIFLFFFLLSFQYIQIKRRSIKLFYCYHFWQQNNILSFWQLQKLASNFNFFFCISLNCKFFKKNIYTPITYPIDIEKQNENNARYWRLRSLHRFIFFSIFHLKKREKNNTNILQGHTSSDSLETFVFNSFRHTKSPKIDQLKMKIERKNLLKNREKNVVFFPQVLKYPTYPIKKKNLLFIKNKKTNKIFAIMKEKNSSENIQNSFFFFKEKKKNKLISFLRPLLFFDFYRNDIFCFNKNYNIPLIYDQSNQNINISRNTIRFYIFPMLRILFHKKIEKNFSRFLLEKDFHINKNKYRKLIEKAFFN
jgi:tRNA(Ile)-lysidine synthase TilS/MesJ